MTIHSEFTALVSVPSLAVTLSARVLAAHEAHTCITRLFAAQEFEHAVYAFPTPPLDRDDIRERVRVHLRTKLHEVVWPLARDAALLLLPAGGA